MDYGLSRTEAAAAVARMLEVSGYWRGAKQHGPDTAVLARLGAQVIGLRLSDLSETEQRRITAAASFIARKY